LARPDAAKNTKMQTGLVEIQVQEIEILSQAGQVPFLPEGKNTVTDE